RRRSGRESVCAQRTCPPARRSCVSRPYTRPPRHGRGGRRAGGRVRVDQVEVGRPVERLARLPALLRQRPLDRRAGRGIGLSRSLERKGGLLPLVLASLVVAGG